MKKGIKSFAIWAIIIVIAIVLFASIKGNNSNEMSYSELVNRINNKDSKIESIEIDSSGETAEVTIKEDKYPKTVVLPSIDEFIEQIGNQIKDGSVNIKQAQKSFLDYVDFQTILLIATTLI